MRFTHAALALAGLLAASAVQAAESKTVSDTKDAIKGSGKYGDAGCGLGSMVFGSQEGAVQIFAATTNNIIIPQTFAISTGTSNCQPGAFASGTKHLVETNREALAKDVARGQGELIGALTVINRCADSAQVGAALQREFPAIFPSAGATNDQVTQAILHTLQDPALGCAKG